jgi:hypothetical protein
MLESLAVTIFIWVSRYVATFCLVSITLWAVGMYLWGRDWPTRVRDAGIFFATIGVLTVILAFKPTKTDAFFWPPLTWFSFTMLLILELLWLEFLVESLLRTCTKLGKAELPKDNTPRFPSRSTTAKY